MLISQNMEISMGRDIDRGLRRTYGFYGSPQLNAYITEIGQKLVPYTHRPTLEYHFAVLDTPVENAFAAPGGYIYITRGLLALMNSEAEMATVLGHELGHVNARHSARQMTRSILFLGIILVASELSEDFRKIAPISMIATQLLFLKYSRKDEYQADALGVEYSLKAGYAAGKMVNFFSSLQRLTGTKGSHRIPNFLSTHPLTPRRIEKVKELLQAEEQNNPGQMLALAVERKSYLKKIDGLIYGMNPRQGYVEGNTFYHPSMKFYFQVPYKWTVDNTPQRVTLTSPDKKAMIILTAQSGSQDLDAFSKKMIADLKNSRLDSQRYGIINGFQALHTHLTMFADKKEEGKKVEDMTVRISNIQKENTIFSFFTASAVSHDYTYKNDMFRTVQSFNKLRHAKYLSKQPQRLYVKRVQRQQRLRHYLSQKGIPRKNWDKISLINAIPLDQRLQPNRLIKVIY